MMNDIEKDYINDLPEETNYPALKTLATISSIIGKSLFVLAILWILVIVYSFAVNYFLELQHPDIKSLSRLLLPFGMFFIGFPFVLNAEIINLLIDLQANADRQSILQTLILNRLIQKGKP
jgi:hypothetical protein